MRRPFRTNIVSHPDHDDATLSVTIDLRLALTAEVGDRVSTLARRFLDLAESGALSGDSISPADTGITSVDVSISDRRVSWSFSDVRVDGRSVHVLVNLIHAFHETVAEVDAVTIEWSQAPEGVDLDELQLPSPGNAPPFELIRDDGTEAFDIVLAFAEPQEQHTIDEIEETLGHWLQGVEAGAFATEATEPHLHRVRFDSDEPHATDSDAIVWSIEQFWSSSNALDALVNVATRIHHTQAPLESLEIGQ